MKVPTVCVGMPAYNASFTISAAIDALLQQTFTDFELIISDNASTDDTLAICREYARRDPRVQVVTQPVNIGANNNYNAVAKLARAPYFKWASSNDLLHARFLERCVEVLTLNPDCVLCTARTRLFSGSPEDGSDYREAANLNGEDAIGRFLEVFQRMRLNNVMNGVVRREVLSGVGFMPAVMGADVHMVAEIALHGRIIEIPETMFYRRMTTSTATALQSQEGKVRHVYGSDTWRGLFPNWRQCAIGTRSVMRAPLSARDRMRGLAFASRFWVWQSRGLLLDIADALRFPFRKVG